MMVLNKKREIQTRQKDDLLHSKSGETVAQIAQRGGRCSRLGNL